MGGYSSFGGSDEDDINGLLAKMASYKPSPQDEELSQQWRDNEQSAIGKMNAGGDDYDLGKILRDIAPLAVGTIGDAVTNHGRGIADIAQYSMQNMQQNLARDYAQQKADREFALKEREQREKTEGGSGFDRAYKQAQILQQAQRIKQAEENVDLRGQTVDQGARRTRIAEDQNSYLNNPDDPRTIQVKARLIANGANPDEVEHMSANALRDSSVVTGHEVEHAFSNLEREDAAKKAAATEAARTGAEINTQAALAPKSAATAATIGAARSGAETGARIKTESDLADTSAATAQANAEGTTQGRVNAEHNAATDSFLAPVGREVTDPERAKRVAQDPKLGAEASEKLRASGSMLDSMHKMVAIREQEAQGAITPGRAKSQLLTARAELEGAFAKGHDMATINEGDRASMGQFLGVPDASALDLVGLITGGDVKLDQLKGVEDVLRMSDERIAREYGFGAYGSARSDTPMAPAPNRSRAPRPMAGGSNDGMVTIRLGGESARVPIDQARRLKAQNPSIEGDF